MKSYYERLLLALQEYGVLVQATVVKAQGSVPRETGAKMIFFPDGGSEGTVGGGIFEAKVREDALTVFRNHKPLLKTYAFNQEGKYAIGAVCGGSVEVLMERITTSPRLIVVGGGHVGQALIKMASLLDFSITLIEDRAEYASVKYPVEGVEIIHSPEDFSAIPEITENCYVCLVSKGFVSDEAALRRVIDSPAKYIGMIGSRKKVETVYANMQKDGFDRKKFARVHAPIGIDIEADTPEEIAVAILAEIIATKNKPE